MRGERRAPSPDSIRASVLLDMPVNWASWLIEMPVSLRTCFSSLERSFMDLLARFTAEGDA